MMQNSCSGIFIRFNVVRTPSLNRGVLRVAGWIAGKMVPEFVNKKIVDEQFYCGIYCGTSSYK